MMLRSCRNRRCCEILSMRQALGYSPWPSFEIAHPAGSRIESRRGALPTPADAALAKRRCLRWRSRSRSAPRSSMTLFAKARCLSSWISGPPGAVRAACGAGRARPCRTGRRGEGRHRAASGTCLAAQGPGHSELRGLLRRQTAVSAGRVGGCEHDEELARTRRGVVRSYGFAAGGLTASGTSMAPTRSELRSWTAARR